MLGYIRLLLMFEEPTPNEPMPKTMKALPFCLLFLLITAFSSAQTLTGTIRDAANNEPLIGASIVIKGTTIGTTTDLNGRFTLNVNRKPPSR